MRLIWVAHEATPRDDRRVDPTSAACPIFISSIAFAFLISSSSQLPQFSNIQPILVIQYGVQTTIQGNAPFHNVFEELTKYQLNNPTLFKDKSYVDGEWVDAASGKRFEVIGTTALSV